MVFQQCLEVVAHTHHTLCLHHLFGHREADDEEHETCRCDHYHCHLPARGGRHPHTRLKQAAKWFPCRKGYKRAGISEEHTERGEYGFLFRTVGYHSEHGSVGDIDAGVDGHHEHVCHVSPDEFAGIREIGRGEEQYAAYCKRSCKP